MSIELSRAAHFSGEGLPHPVDVWHGRLNDKTEVYFTQPYDRSLELGTVALTATEVGDGNLQGTRFDFQPNRGTVAYAEQAMLFNTVMYPTDANGRVHPRGDAAELEARTFSGSILRHNNIARARNLPQPFDERL